LSQGANRRRNNADGGRLRFAAEHAEIDGHGRADEREHCG
jgi:hypothetical protein